ncbi:hypothetical protein [Treponema phagedenis]|uniref:hypothetical protein n=1 Tax=Treponema phagedenis TaxID=162 RepID=UPI0001F63CFB|nr:hypothetical protein [Treponema phagedenis]EFW37570.1 hypothetical protein HMPREF9554_01941 [Treponema phagedenis F0421]NVP24850.1 hypothetical protein [Treponema phagedenis]QKS93190.1 hypothetical protein HPJ96_11990 [Treponema phagedenis]QLC59029.1 hypothetical protein HW453_09660 [Treponema phagedenis]TYT79242.1 hypothetical protein FS559_09105 [Treponema phagedenis]
MKIAAKIVLGLAVVSLLFGCATKRGINKPVIIDHKNQKWDKAPPDWVSMERNEIEQMAQYEKMYIFKFESEKSKDLEGGQLWLRNFQAASELARMISQRIRDTGAAAAVGNKDLLDSYIEEVVHTVSEAEINGIKRESDYWVQRRFFDAEGEPEGDFYTVLALYSVPRKTLDKLIENAINGIKPKTEEQIRTRDLVKQSMEKGL